ncbi:MAG: class I SAM-dependent methyltransferase [Thermoproteaceae archaeon]|nr:class I SAM-dependent methyltransferase [Thermoproteaceae archaeon]
MSPAEFFDGLYLEILRHYRDERATEAEAALVRASLNIAPGARALDVACGSGRHMKYMPAGSVVGVDINLDYLKIAKAHGDVVQADVRLLPFRREAFHGAYIMHSTINLFERDDAAEAITWLSGTVKRGGRILIDALNKDRAAAMCEISGGAWKHEIRAGGLRVECVVRCDGRGSRLVEVWRICRGSALVSERSLVLTTYGLGELSELLEGAGATVERVYGNYSGGEYFRGSERLIVIAVRTRQPAGRETRNSS